MTVYSIPLILEGFLGEDEAINEALRITIKALEEVEQYRALGTVEGFKSALDSSAEYYNQMKEYKAKLQECEEKLVEYEAVGTITQIYEKIGGLDAELGKYHSLGTVEELKEAKEKQIPKKPIRYEGTARVDCPVCGNTVAGISGPFGNYCSKCGNKIDWEEGGTSD